MIEALNELDLVCSATRLARRPGDPVPPGRDRPAQAAALHAPRRSRSASSRRRRRRWPGCSPQPATVAAAFAATRRSSCRHRPPRWPPCAASGRRRRCWARWPRACRPTRHRGAGDRRRRREAQGLRPLRRSRRSRSASCPAPRWTCASAPPARTTVKGSAKAWREAPPTLASVEAERSTSIAARLVLAEPQAVRRRPAQDGHRRGRRAAHGGGHAAPALVARTGAASRDAGRFHRGPGGRQGGPPRPCACAPPRGSAGATLLPGQTVVLKMPNARADAASTASARAWRWAAHRPASSARPRRRAAGRSAGRAGCRPAAGQPSRSPPAPSASSPSARARRPTRPSTPAWPAGTPACRCLMPAGRPRSRPAAWCAPTASALTLHRERLDAGWVSGAELARGVSTVATTFSEAPRTVVIVL